MRKLFILSISVLFLSALYLNSCKKDSTSSSSGTSGNTTKTLNKSTLTPKKWYSEGSSVIHDFKAGNVYGTMGGSWQWKNNTDTMSIISQAGYLPTEWKFYWNTDTSMQCEKMGTFTKLEYRLHAW